MLNTTIKNILIIRLSSLGDILLTTPLLRWIKKSFPDIQIDFLMKGEFIEALKHNPNLRSVFLYENPKPERRGLIRKLFNNNYDLIVDLQNNFRSRNITIHLRGRVKRFRKYSLRKILLVKFKINLMRNLPPIPERYAGTLGFSELDGKGLDLFPVEFPEKEQYLENKLRIGFCPGAKHYTKRWPEEYFIALGRNLASNGYKILLFGGKTDRKLCRRICEAIPESCDLSNDNSLLNTARWMRICRVILCNDSGLMHTANAAGVPVIAIFGSTVREFGFSPYKNRNLILENNSLSCRPCSHIGRAECPKNHFNCMRELTPEIVSDSLQKFLLNL